MTETTQPEQTQALPATIHPAASTEIEVAGFGTRSGFELMQRMAKMLAASALVPKEFQNNIPNTVIALEMAQRIGASPLAVMQNLYVVHGKPSWSSTFIIAALNNTGKFSPLRFRITREDKPIEVITSITAYEKGEKVSKTIKETILNKTCIAYAIEKATGEVLESPPVSLEMAVLEGWYSKLGSKWKTMDELMLRYRTATLFGRLYAPEVLMGMQTTEEVIDITPPPQPEGGNGSGAGRGGGGMDNLKAFLGDADPAPTPPEETELPLAAEEQKEEGPSANLLDTRTPPAADEEPFSKPAAEEGSPPASGETQQHEGENNSQGLEPKYSDAFIVAEEAIKEANTKAELMRRCKAYVEDNAALTIEERAELEKVKSARFQALGTK
ncbi:MAG: hypothetical protein FWE89_04240 [Syntrophaceae bacterium]|nr:hypothetical protein [Syntrophaceae bacterium]